MPYPVHDYGTGGLAAGYMQLLMQKNKWGQEQKRQEQKALIEALRTGGATPTVKEQAERILSPGVADVLAKEGERKKRKQLLDIETTQWDRLRKIGEDAEKYMNSKKFGPHGRDIAKRMFAKMREGYSKLGVTIPEGMFFDAADFKQKRQNADLKLLETKMTQLEKAPSAELAGQVRAIIDRMEEVWNMNLDAYKSGVGDVEKRLAKTKEPARGYTGEMGQAVQAGYPATAAGVKTYKAKTRLPPQPSAPLNPDQRRKRISNLYKEIAKLKAGKGHGDLTIAIQKWLGPEKAGELKGDVSGAIAALEQEISYQKNMLKYKSPESVRAAVKAKKITEEEAVSILVELWPDRFSR